VGLDAGWLTGDAVELFEAERRRLFGLAYRLLGSASDAEDVLQGAFLAWNAADRATVAEPAAWLTTAVTNLCLNELASAVPGGSVMWAPGWPSWC
jgi:RNA polymerase sigma-70 factor (ECF subfamily)